MPSSILPTTDRPSRVEVIDFETDNADASGALKLDSVSKSYGTESVIDDLSFSVEEGEILTLLRPPSCGKTAAFRPIAGLDRPDGGEIRLNGNIAFSGDTFRAFEEHGVSVAFQEFALFPHLTAAENIAFSLKDFGESKRDECVADLLNLVGLKTRGGSYPGELSGGQQQWIILTRLLALKPATLFLDEPFSNLGVGLRVQTRKEARRILKEAGVTVVSVIRSQREAMSISGRVAVINDGDLEQVDEPEQVFRHPGSWFITGFLGYIGFLPERIAGDAIETELGTVDRDQIHGLMPGCDDMDIDTPVRPDDMSAHPCDNSGGHDKIVGKCYLRPTILYEVRPHGGDAPLRMRNHDETVPTDGYVEATLDASHKLTWFLHEQRLESGLYSDRRWASET